MLKDRTATRNSNSSLAASMCSDKFDTASSGGTPDKERSAWAIQVVRTRMRTRHAKTLRGQQTHGKDVRERLNGKLNFNCKSTGSTHISCAHHTIIYTVLYIYFSSSNYLYGLRVDSEEAMDQDTSNSFSFRNIFVQ